MPTSAIALGQLTTLSFVDEATFGTAPGTGWRKAYYYTSGLKEDVPPDPDDVIGGDMNNFRDVRPAQLGLSTLAGDLDVPLCIQGVGDWLKLLLGAPTTTNVSGSNYQHIFKSGASVLPTRAIELFMLTSDYRQFTGLAAKAAKLSFKPDRGVQKLNLSLIGKAENLLSATGAGSPSATRTYSPLRNFAATLKVDGTAVGQCLSHDFAYDSGLMTDRYINGTNRIAAVVAESFAKADGTTRIRYTGQTFDGYADANSDHTMEVLFTVDANTSLSILLNAVRFGRGGAKITGPAGVEQELPWRAAQTASAEMLTITLKNQQSAY